MGPWSLCEVYCDLHMYIISSSGVTYIIHKICNNCVQKTFRLLTSLSLYSCEIKKHNITSFISYVCSFCSSCYVRKPRRFGEENLAFSAIVACLTRQATLEAINYNAVLNLQGALGYSMSCPKHKICNPRFQPILLLHSSVQKPLHNKHSFHCIAVKCK